MAGITKNATNQLIPISDCEEVEITSPALKNFVSFLRACSHVLEEELPLYAERGGGGIYLFNYGEESKGDVSFHPDGRVTLHTKHGTRAKMVEFESYDDKVATAFIQMAAMDKCQNRIKEMAELKDGWYDGKGEATSQLALDGVAKLLEERPEYAGLVGIFPTGTGGLSVEFNENWGFDAEFREDGEIEVMYGKPPNVKFENFTGLTPEFFEFMDKYVAVE